MTNISCAFVLQGCAVWLFVALAFLAVWRFLLAPRLDDE